MIKDGPLLIAQQGKDGPFLWWLEKLGLKDFVKKYPIGELVRWGWLVPQRRVIFPKDFFLSWTTFPCLGESCPTEFENYSMLWDSYWSIEPDDGKLWPLHPFFAPDNPCENILTSEGTYSPNVLLPDEFKHPRGQRIRPYGDFFFHWQAFALIDVIRSSDCIAQIFHTPDVLDRAKGVVRVAEYLDARGGPEVILNIENRWGGLAKIMTWISHYRSFVSALNYHHLLKNPTRAQRLTDRRLGAIFLAEYLGITADLLAVEIKNRLLYLASDWMNDLDGKANWISRAWPYLQRDIILAVNWLCYLNGRTFDSYLVEWNYQFGLRERWAKLSDVLPWEYWAERDEFLRLVPEYFRSQKLNFSLIDCLDEVNLVERVDSLRNGNYPFQSFLGAFKSLHDHLGKRNFEETGIEFRDLRPLDYYSLLAIRAESVLLYSIDKSDYDADLDRQNLETYIAFLAEKRGISAGAIAVYKSLIKPYTRLHKKPAQPIRSIMALALGLPEKEEILIKAFLCCVLARNYFAHHYYLDGDQLPRSEESAFMLASLISTVIFLA